MMRGQNANRTQLLLSLLLMGLLGLFVLLQGAPTAAEPYELDSAEPWGLLALNLWLTEMGHPVSETVDESGSFALDAEGRLLLLFPNRHAYDSEHVAAIDAWVQAGGTLVILGDALADDALVDEFGVRLGQPTVMLSQASQQQPLIPGATLPIHLTGEHPTLDITDADNAVALFADDTGLVTVAAQQLGAGQIWYWSEHHLPINAHLRDPAQAALVLLLLHNIPTGSSIQIDTYHLFGPPIPPTAVTTLQEWLYYTPWGWALLFLALLTVVTLVLQGRRLGPPLPTTATVRRREAAEYVVALANLMRRAQQRQSVAQHHKQRLKRVLARRAHISATLDDETFLRQLATPTTALGPPGGVAVALLDTGTVDETTIRTLFAKLDRAKDDQTVVAAVADVDNLIQGM